MRSLFAAPASSLGGGGGGGWAVLPGSGQVHMGSEG